MLITHQITLRLASLEILNEITNDVIESIGRTKIKDPELGPESLKPLTTIHNDPANAKKEKTL